MRTSSYLTNLVSLNWWKKEITERPGDHITPAVCVASTTFLISSVWGKYMAIGFLAISIITYPLTHKQIQYLQFMEDYGAAQAAACVTIPLMTPFMPPAMPMPLYIVLAVSILRKEWRLSRSVENSAQLIQEKDKLLQKLSKNLTTLKGKLDELEKALSILLKQK